jgi:hypothetical protein
VGGDLKEDIVDLATYSLSLEIHCNPEGENII